MTKSIRVSVFSSIHAQSIWIYLYYNSELFYCVNTAKKLPHVDIKLMSLLYSDVSTALSPYLIKDKTN